MLTKKSASWVLWYEILGFSVITMISWVDELLSLPSKLFGGTYRPNFRESIFETIIVLIVATPVVVLTKRLISRFYFLEGFFRICAWCKKVDQDGHWVPLAEFFQQRFNSATSHGICPACLAELGKVTPEGHRLENH